LWKIIKYSLSGRIVALSGHNWRNCGRIVALLGGSGQIGAVFRGRGPEAKVRNYFK